MEDFSLALIWLGFFASLFFGWYFYLQARNKERMALIEKNVDLHGIFKAREARFRFPWFKVGMIITGTGLGFWLGMIFSLLPFLRGLDEGAMMFGCVLLFGGLGMMIAHILDKPKAQ